MNRSQKIVVKMLELKRKMYDRDEWIDNFRARERDLNIGKLVRSLSRKRNKEYFNFISRF